MPEVIFNGPAGRLDDLAPDLVPFRAGKIESLDINLVDLGQFSAIDIGQLGDLSIARAAIEINCRP